MAELPIIDGEPKRENVLAKRSLFQGLFVHSLRVAVFVVILLMLRFAHRQTRYVENELARNPVATEFVKKAFSGSSSGTDEDSKFTITGLGPDRKLNSVIDEKGAVVGAVLQTSPTSDHLIGYSGPTNCLIAIDQNNSIRSIKILSSGDTDEHVNIIKRNQEFYDSFRGMEFGRSEADQARWQDLDAVSGATLTSYAIIASVANRMSGTAPKLKFPGQPDQDNVRRLFSDAMKIEQESGDSIWSVRNDRGEKLGSVLTTTPAGDHLSGYQGPTATLAGFDLTGQCIGLVVDQTYDNEPYASYLNDDYSFLDFYLGKTLSEIARLNPAEHGIDGVSGATMTSMSVAEALPIAAARALAREEPRSANGPNGFQLGTYTRPWGSYSADGVTIVLMIVGVCLSFTKLRRAKAFRICFQWISISILGFYSGHMLSMASTAGWATHAIPWRVAPGLVFLAAAALLVPIFSKHQPYCQHVCPFGAIQQLTRNRVGWKLRMSKPVRRILGMIPYLLLAFVVVVAMTDISFNLASIEPFDGFGFRVAGWVTISVFILGILFSAVSPMAYCRFGCPTGALLDFVKYQSTSERLGLRDVGAVALALLAFGLLYV